MRTYMALLQAILLIVGVSWLQADTIHVPSEQPTIQAGINATVDGDTVLVAGGTYTGDGNRDIDFLGKAIIVMSENGAESCVIDCEGHSLEPHRGFYFGSGEDSASVLQGFTIQNGYGSFPQNSGGVIGCLNSSPIIRENIITNNTATIGGGIWCSTSSPTISYNIIAFNSSSSGGGGIYCVDSSPMIVGNTIEYNNAGGYGGGIYCIDSSPTIASNTIEHNHANKGGGLSLHDASLPVVLENTISENSAANGGGIYCRVDSTAIIEGNIITGNNAVYDGGGIFCFGYSNPRVVENIITDNTASRYGGGIYCYKCAAAILDCQIMDNQSDQGGGIKTYSCSPTITDCLIIGNEAGMGGGMHFHIHSPLVTDCRIMFNVAEWRGGGVYCLFVDSEFTGSVIAYNSSVYSSGGGFYARGSDPVIQNCTIFGNSATSGGALVCDGPGATPTITNGILWENVPDEIELVGGVPIISFSDVFGGWVGEGNIDDDPLFLDPGNDNFNLLPDSPCIDAGDPTYEVPLGGGCRIDMGAHEYWKGFNCRKHKVAVPW